MIPAPIALRDISEWGLNMPEDEATPKPAPTTHDPSATHDDEAENVWVRSREVGIIGDRGLLPRESVGGFGGLALFIVFVVGAAAGGLVLWALKGPALTEAEEAAAFYEARTQVLLSAAAEGALEQVKRARTEVAARNFQAAQESIEAAEGLVEGAGKAIGDDAPLIGPAKKSLRQAYEAICRDARRDAEEALAQAEGNVGGLAGARPAVRKGERKAQNSSAPAQEQPEEKAAPQAKGQP